MEKESENINENEILSLINLEEPTPKKIKTNIKPDNSGIIKSKKEIQSKTACDDNILNEEITKEINYSIELLEEEEEEINSDEYISSSNLDVETDTYIDYSVINNNNSKNKMINKVKTKNLKNFVKAININNNDYLSQCKKRENSNSNHKSKNKKDGYYAYSPLNINNKNKFRKKIKINDNNEKNIVNNKNNNNKDNFYKKLDVKEIQNKKEKEKINQNIKNIINDRDSIKYYSLMEYHLPPLNNIFDEDIKSKNNNSNINELYAIKNKNNADKNMNSRIEIDGMGKVNKITKHVRCSTLVDNNINRNKYMKEFLMKHKFKNNDEFKYKQKKIFSPINKKIGINSMKKINTINNTETHPSLINNTINNTNINSYIPFNGLSNNTRTISTNENDISKYIVSKKINLNNINKSINRVNHIIFSPSIKIIGKPILKKVNSSFANKMVTANSINTENNPINIINPNKNKFSERLLTYDFQDHKLTRNRTFKNKRHFNNKNKFFNLLLNKKKININQAKELLISSNKSPRLKLKMVIETKNKLNLQNYTNQNKSNRFLFNNNIITSSSNRKLTEKYNTITNTVNQSTNRTNNNITNKKEKKNNSKNYSYHKKDKQVHNSNKMDISIKTNNKASINPFNSQINKNNKIFKKNNLIQLKAKYKFLQKEKSDTKYDINITSVNFVKKSSNNNKITKEKIVKKKMNRIRAKTLIEGDYLRDIIINSINNDSRSNKTLFNYKNNSKNKSKKENKYASINQLKNKANYASSVNNMIIKSPSERHNINFNININMSNNNYKKLVYHYHGHNKSSGNYSYANTNSNLNKIQRKKIKI